MGCAKTRVDASLLPIIGQRFRTKPKRNTVKSRKVRPVHDFYCPKCGTTKPNYPNYRHICQGPREIAHEIQRREICSECPHNKDGVCKPLQIRYPDKPCIIEIGIAMPEVECPMKKWQRVIYRCDQCGTVKFDAGGLSSCPVCKTPPKMVQPSVVIPKRLSLPAPSDTAIFTFHFNFQQSKRLRETYYEWIETVAHPVKCIEVVMDGEQEIEGSQVIHATEDNFLWQKERLINIAIESLPDEVKYVAWVDHDVVFPSRSWLKTAREILASGFDAVQLFEKMRYLDSRNRTLFENPGSTFSYLSGNSPDTAPGAAWMATTDFIRRAGGIYDRNIVGGGDAIWFTAITQAKTKFVDRQPESAQRDARRWMSAVPKARATFLPGSAMHLWHGNRKNRQYISRDAILREEGFDIDRHIETGDNGLLKWTAEAPQRLKERVKRYFTDRREDDPD